MRKTDSPINRLAPAVPNPQGKGLVPVLDQLSNARLVHAQPKDPAECLLDYLISALVLSAEFRFKPVAGKTYYLYFCSGWQLSLVSPEQWRGQGQGQSASQSARVFIGCCQLRPDFTWQLDDIQSLDEYPEVVSALHDFETSFKDQLSAEDSVSEGLPFHRSTLPFWQRIHAHALAKSLKSSMIGAGVAEWTGQQMLSNAGSVVPRLGDPRHS